MESCLQVGAEQQAFPLFYGANFSMCDHELIDQKDVGERSLKKIDRTVWTSYKTELVVGNLAE